MREAVIVDSIRTPIGNLNGALAAVRADDLAAMVIRAMVDRNKLDSSRIEEVIFGCANQAGEDNRNVARMASLLAGLPVGVPALTVNRLCASGLAAVNLAARAIRANEGDLFIVGGVENMSRAPYALAKTGSGGNLTAFDTSLGWRFVNPKMEAAYGVDPMGVTAENIADQTGISRESQDAFTCSSHQRAVFAQDSGLFSDEILPVIVPQRKGEALVVDTDERPRRDTSLESLARLKPAFRSSGTVTAGNSSGLNDGASALLMMELQTSIALGYKPLARIVSAAAAGVEPRLMGLGPIPATQKALKRAGLTTKDLDLAEINEAFAVQTLAVMQALDLDPDKVNVNGGAIALGHPLGCSGARILTTLLHEMARRAPSTHHSCFGLATLCVGVGQGEATIVEWIG